MRCSLLGEDAVVPTGNDLVSCITDCYAEFTSRLDETGLTWTCTCNVCEVKNTLDLKFVVHHGSYIVQAIGTHVEVLGPDITVAHRLVKNTAVSKVGTPARVLFSGEAESALRLALKDAVRFTEPVDGADPVDAVAIPLRV